MSRHVHHQFHISDFGGDLDDEIAALVAIFLHRDPELSSLDWEIPRIRLLGTIANFFPSLIRARVGKGTYEQLGASEVPVAIGTDCGRSAANTRQYEFDVPYLAEIEHLRTDGVELFREVVGGLPENQTVDLVLMSGFTDALQLFNNDPVLFRAKIRSVALMGGVKTAGNEVVRDVCGHFIPDRTVNNEQDYDAAVKFYRALQITGIPTTVVTREAAYAAGVPRNFYEQLAGTGHPVGRRLQAAQQKYFEQLWEQANREKGDSLRTLPWGPEDHPRNAEWFCRSFCGGAGRQKTGGESIWEDVKTVPQYDSLAVLAATPGIRERYFRPHPMIVNGVEHSLIGLNSRETGIAHPSELASFLAQAATRALS